MTGSVSADTPRSATFREVLAIREYRALYAAQTLSIAGDQLARIAVAIIIFNRTGSTFLTGLSYAVSYLPWLIGGPFLSGLADRHPRRSVMVVADLIRTVLVLVMALPAAPTVLLIALVSLVALGEPPFAAARSSMIPDVVRDNDKYAAAATLSNSTNQVAVVLGFLVGGGLVAAVGTSATLCVDAATFAASTYVAVRYVQHRPAAISDRRPWLHEVAEGAAVVFGDRNLRWLVVVTWLILGAIVSTETAAVPYAHAHNGGAVTAGILIASLPLGMVLGALVLGRMVSLEQAERLMLPLSLLALALLALTFVNASPAATCLIWAASGIASATTITANRVFVMAVPPPLRGRAFGIAVTGIAAAQGIYSLLTGYIAEHAGPAHAVTDLALPSLALVVAFSATSTAFSRDRIVPIMRETPRYSQGTTMPSGLRRPETRIWALNLALVICALSSVYALQGEPARIASAVPAWWLFAIFLVGQAYPLQFEVGRQSFQVVLETVPLVLGLIFLPPLLLVGIRIAAYVLVHVVVHRQALVKLTFNAASHGVCTLTAALVFRGLASASHGLHPEIWGPTFAAVITSEVVGSALLVLVLAVRGGVIAFRQQTRVLAFGALVSVVMTFLALVTAAALDYDVNAAWAISVFVLLTIAGAQTYHRLAERAAALDRLYVVARELGPVAAEPADLAPALTQLRQVIRAHSLELLVANPPGSDRLVAITVFDRGGVDDSTVEERRQERGVTNLLESRRREATWRRVLGPRPGYRKETEGLSAAVRTGGQDLGVLTAIAGRGHAVAFDRSDLRLLEAAADQLAAALEKGRLIDSLRRAATLDTLTGLANLDSLRSFLDTTLEGASGGVLILLNLDRFREVNDMLGHAAGDAVLAEVAQRLQLAPSQGSLVARVGGDQFAIAIPGSAGSEVARLAAMAVKSRVDGSLRLAEVSADVRVTVGIARAPDHGRDSATLLRRAEMAMAASKGTNSGIGEWEPEFERHGSRRLQLLTGLRSALSDGSLEIEYQPKLWLGSGEVTGFEALVRWTHPELGPISPSEFIPLAEATGLISALTSTVLRQSLAACRTWHDAGKPVGVAVNVSARSLDDGVLLGQVAAMLTASGIEPRWLTLEITESSLMEDHARSLAVLRELRMLGVRLSIDDFGTGYSSLHQLRGLPVHEVKIDRSFIETVDTDDADRAVVRAVVELCDSLGLVTVAEGVEKAAQAYVLETLGVGQVQGYFHGKPMPNALAAEWLFRRHVAVAVDGSTPAERLTAGPEMRMG